MLPLVLTILISSVFSAKNGHLGCYQNGVFEQELASKYLQVGKKEIDACVWNQKYSWKEGCKTFNCYLEGNNICIPYKIQSVCDRVVFKNGGKRHCYKTEDGCGGFVAMFKKGSIYSNRDSEICDNYYWSCRRIRKAETVRISLKERRGRRRRRMQRNKRRRRQQNRRSRRFY